MSARAIGPSTLSFGLVSIPVNLYSTGDTARRISFKWIHEECESCVKRQYNGPPCDVVVPRGEMTKGYEFSKGQYVLLDADAMKAAEG